MTEREKSGRLWLHDHVIHYESSFFPSWSLPLSEFRVIGECTNQDGPFLDDYFFVFLRNAHEMWFEASFYAEGRERFLETLGQCLKTEIHCRLTPSTDFASIVWWPRVLKGKPVFAYRAEGWKGRLLCRNQQYISPDVNAYLESGGLNHGN